MKHMDRLFGSGPYWETVTPPRRREDFFKDTGAPVVRKSQTLGGEYNIWTEVPRWCIWIAGVLSYNEGLAARFFTRVREAPDDLQAFVALTNIIAEHDISTAAENYAMTGDWNQSYTEHTAELRGPKPD